MGLFYATAVSIPFAALDAVVFPLIASLSTTLSARPQGELILSTAAIEFVVFGGIGLYYSLASATALAGVLARRLFEGSLALTVAFYSVAMPVAAGSVISFDRIQGQWDDLTFDFLLLGMSLIPVVLLVLYSRFRLRPLRARVLAEYRRLVPSARVVRSVEE